MWSGENGSTQLWRKWTDCGVCKQSGAALRGAELIQTKSRDGELSGLDDRTNCRVQTICWLYKIP